MNKRTLAFEIGTEELPAFDLHAATQQVHDLMSKQFTGLFDFEDARVYSTPRRIIIVLTGVPEEMPAYTEDFRGPEVRIAFDGEGNPTKAAEGFARGKGVSVDALERRMEGEKEYVYAVREVPAKRVIEILPDALMGLMNGISWPKAQRWGSFNEEFSRPVRWLLALFGSEVVPLEYAGLTSGNTTRGHRFLAPGPFEVSDAAKLIEVLQDSYIVPSEVEREESIRSQVAAIEEKTGLVAELPAHTMQEVVNLCEYPTVMVGEFDELFLAVPKEITVDAMLVHQRYFPLFNADGSLSNKFLITSNGNPEFEANIVDGNQRVVAARLYDAKFFYDEDLKQPLEAYVEKLDNVVFQEALGTTRAKTNRVCALAEFIATEAGLSQEEVEDAKRAAFLCKADLVTSAVVEFTQVQGIMGRYYALACGEKPQVAQAIADHYRPRFAGDDLPESNVGKVVAMSDKLDTICGLFAVGQAPTGSSDPFALRRAAIGILAILKSGLNVSIVKAIKFALNSYKESGLEFDYDATLVQVRKFFITRVAVMLRENGKHADAVEAVLAASVVEPMQIMARVDALELARTQKLDVFEDLATAYARANNLRDESLGCEYDEALFTPAEKALGKALVETRIAIEQHLASGEFAAAINALSHLRGPIDAYFEETMVMCDDPELRINHLKTLNAFIQVFANVADFGKMAKTTK